MLLSSHLLAEVEQMCTRVGVLDRGRLVVQDQMDALRGPTGRTILHTPDVAETTRELGDLVAEVDGERLVISAGNPSDLVTRLVSAGVRVDEVAPERRTLEQVVLDATSEPHRVGSR